MRAPLSLEGWPVLVHLDAVRKVYRAGSIEVVAIDGVSLELLAGEFVVLLGPSGSGKTTLLNLLGGLDTPTAGAVRVGDEDVGHLSEAALTRYRRHSVGFVFQFFNLIPTLTALENVQLAAELVTKPRSAREILTAVGLGDRLDHFPSELSGGEQQRIAIARALVTDPALVLCDEPTGNLDEETGKHVLEVMHDLGKREQKTFVLVTHNSIIARMADRVFHLRNGKIASVEANPIPVAASELSW